jgi:hypothetical protein
VVHIDFQASASADKHREVLVYNALLHRLYKVPVHTVVLLLRPEARHGNLDGSLRYEARQGRGKMDFSYEVIRLWEQPVETLLAGGLGTLPLAPLGRLPEGVALEAGLTEVLEQAVRRIQREAPPEQARRLVSATFVLTGLRMPRERARKLFLGVRAVQESEGYLAILDQGGIEALRRVLLRQGRKRFGEPNEATQQTLMAIDDLDRLERLSDRILDVSSWQELLQTP